MWEIKNVNCDAIFYPHTAGKKHRTLRWQLLQIDARNELIAWRLLHCHTFNELLMHHFKTMAHFTNDFNHNSNSMKYSYLWKSVSCHYILTKFRTCDNSTVIVSYVKLCRDHLVRTWIRLNQTVKWSSYLKLLTDNSNYTEEIMLHRHWEIFWLN